MSINLIDPYTMMNSEYDRTPDRDLIAIYHFATELNDPLPCKRLTMAHLVAIRKAELLQDPTKVITHPYFLEPEKLTERAFKLVKFIKEIRDLNCDDLSFLAIKRDDYQYSSYLFNTLKQKNFPFLTEEGLKNALEIMKHLERLQSGPIFERTFLEKLKKAFEEVPDKIKNEYGLKSLEKEY